MSSTTLPPSLAEPGRTRTAHRWAHVAILLPAAILFAWGCLSSLRAPGVYMDAVNPDYLVVGLLHPHADIAEWTLPGNVLFGLFPVLINIYHGALPFYVGLPIYATFGTGVVGIRVANMLFGLVVLAGAAAFLRAFRVRPLVCAVCLSALALDPGFLFSFRTQFYITLLPCAFAFASVAVVQQRPRCPGAGVAIAGGLLAGASVYGYFIYLFLVPTAALHAAFRWRACPRRLKTFVSWLVGLALGGSPFLLGFVLVAIASGGLQAGLEYLRNLVGQLSVGASTLSLWQRIATAAEMIGQTVQDVGPPAMMLAKLEPPSLSLLKDIVLLVIPAAAVMTSIFSSRRSVGLFVVSGFVAGFVGLVCVFGDRLWLHHAAMLMPILYVAFALSVELCLSWVPRRYVALAAVPLLGLGLLMLGGNFVDRQAVLSDLDRTGGAGLSSDAIVRFAEDAGQLDVPTTAFFPDWGVFMSFEMITGGAIPVKTDFGPQQARDVLCKGRDALLALVEGNNPDRLAAWTREVDWGEPDVAIYRQHDQKPVLTVARWHSSPGRRASCRP